MSLKRKKSSEFTYHKKEANTYTSVYDRALNALKKLDTPYNTTMSNILEPIIKGKYKITGDTEFIPIVVGHKEDEIQWACSTSIYTNAEEPETLKEAMIRPNGNL